MSGQNKSGPRSGRLCSEILLLLGCGNETIAPADRRDLQVKRCMLGVTAFVNDFQIRLVAAPDADENFGLVVLTEVSTETALSALH